MEVRLGVVGNRDLSCTDHPALRNSVEHFLHKWVRVLRELAPLPPRCVMINSLAEGADQLVARVALDEALGFSLRCPVPFTTGEYTGLFTYDRDRSVATFHQLASDAEVVELAHSADAMDRDEGYAAAADYVLRHSDMLLALYDPGRYGGYGGSAHTVSDAEGQRLPVVRIDLRDPGKLEALGSGGFERLTHDYLLESLRSAL